MNEHIQKFGPPLAVLGIALYLGWPPAEPMDLGDSTVRAKTVRWKKGDLASPSDLPAVQSDPFASVLIQAAEPETAAGGILDSLAAVAVGPSATDIRDGLIVGGIAKTATIEWAIVNGRVCRRGDIVAVTGFENVSATIEQINADSVVAFASGKRLTIRRAEAKPRPRAPQQPSPTAEVPQIPGVDESMEVDEDAVESESSNPAQQAQLDDQRTHTRGTA